MVGVLLVLGLFLGMVVLLAMGWNVAFWIFFGLLCLVGGGLIFLVCSVFFAGGSASPSLPPEQTSNNQTEDEFNEMAITTMYANYYLDQDDE